MSPRLLIPLLLLLGACAHDTHFPCCEPRLDDIRIASGSEGLSWARGGQLSDDQFLDRYYPSRARDHGLSGRASVRCTVGAGRKISRCHGPAATPAGAGFEEALVRIMNRAVIDPAVAPPGAEIKASFEFHAVVQVQVECEITVERTASGCRPTHPSFRGTYAGSAATDQANGRPPPAGGPTLHPSRERWRVTVPIPLPDA